MTTQPQNEAPARPTELPRRIVLTGFMGSGKTTVGPLVAKRLGWKFLDVDEVIEAEAGVTIAELFTRDGEAAFREREHATIARLCSTGDAPLVLALGGGAIEHALSRALLVSTPATLLVHLEVELATTLKRCRGSEQTQDDRALRSTKGAGHSRHILTE